MQHGPFATAATFLDLSLRFLWTLSIMPSTINPFELLTQSELAGMCAAAATSAPGLGSPLPHLRRDWARQRAARSALCVLYEYCTGTLRYQAAMLGVLELMRRSMWACFRLEREHLHNRSVVSGGSICRALASDTLSTPIAHVLTACLPPSLVVRC